MFDGIILVASTWVFDGNGVPLVVWWIDQLLITYSVFRDVKVDLSRQK